MLNHLKNATRKRNRRRTSKSKVFGVRRKRPGRKLMVEQFETRLLLTVTNVMWSAVDGDPAVPDTVRNNLSATMTEDWTNAALKITLTAGALVNPSTGAGEEIRSGSPDDDSWLDAPNNPNSSVTVINADFSENKDGDPGGQFDWFDTYAGAGVTDGLAARIYATDDAQGTWQIQMFDLDGGITVEGDIVNGAFGSFEEPVLTDDIIGRVGSSGDWWVAKSDGTSFSNEKWGKWSTGVTWEQVLFGDFNGDGMDDVAGRNASNGGWYVSESNGAGLETTKWTTWSTNVTWQNVMVGDFNGDGLDDIAGQVASSGKWWVATSNGASFANAEWGRWSTGVEWIDVRVGDFNGDGSSDIAGRVSTSGDWWVAESTGTAFANAKWSRWSTSVDWNNVATGDFNGDGSMDLVGQVTSQRQLVCRHFDLARPLPMSSGANGRPPWNGSISTSGISMVTGSVT
jgi:hypothetical protein